jgi:putative two-component system response regulator
VTGEEAGKTILLADDEPGIMLLLKILCEGMGYRTIEASNGLEAVEKAVRFSPDLAIMDGAMPVKSGFEAIRELKSSTLTEHIPIIMLTGLQTREDRLKGISAGANDFLTKPVDAEELALRVRNNLKIKEYHDFLKNNAEILEEQVCKRTMELRGTLDELKKASDLVTRGYIDTIFRLAVVSEYKDEDTGTHIRRISYYSKELASTLGMDADFTEGIFHASIMHDIGKVGIPDSILLKPGALSPEEWETMKSHTERGARILSGSDSPYLKMAEAIARSHHERWDGSGYPSGLSGESIPIAARITNIADQYDALRTRRPYKPAFPHAEAVRVITEGDGRTRPRHFDPRILRVFSAHAWRLEEIYEEKKDE